MEQKRVLIVIGAAQSGGAEKRARRISGFLNKFNIESFVFSFYGTKTDGVNIISYSDYKEYKKAGYFDHIKKIREYIDMINPTTVISFLPQYSFYVSYALKKKKYNSIKHISAIVNSKYSIKSKLLLSLSLKRVDEIFYQCNEQKSIFKIKIPSFVMLNPIDIDHYPYVDNLRSHTFIAVGRLEKVKNFELMINSFYDVAKEYPDSVLDIYGSGTEKDNLESLINILGMNKNIYIKDFTDKIDNLYNNYSYFLTTSLYEGFPNSLMEAMLSGLIPICTPFKTGLIELVEDNRNGYISKDFSKEAFSKRIIEAIKGKNVSLSSRNQVIEKCDYKIVIKELINHIA